jgi:sugar phosphate isomerase/epimerase
MVGIFSWYGIALPFEERIKRIKAAGFDSTSIWLGKAEELFENGDLKALAPIPREYGLYVENAHSPYDDINSLWDKYKRDEFQERIKAEIDYCSDNKIPMLVSHLTRGYEIQEPTEYGIEALKNLTRHAEDKNVILALENTRLNDILFAVFDAISSPNLRFCFDSSHDNLYSETKLDTLRKLGPRLVCTHLSDNAGEKDDHWLPFTGTINWDDLCQAFPKEYEGVYTLEVVPKDVGDEGDFLARAKVTIEKIRENIAGAKPQ